MCSRKIDADLILVNEHETISISHKCVESIEEIPKLKLYKNSRELIRQVNSGLVIHGKS